MRQNLNKQIEKCLVDQVNVNPSHLSLPFFVENTYRFVLSVIFFVSYTFPLFLQEPAVEPADPSGDFLPA